MPSSKKSLTTKKNQSHNFFFLCVFSKFHMRDLSLPLYQCLRCYCNFWYLIFLRHWHLLEFSSSRFVIDLFYMSRVKCKQSIISAIKVGSRHQIDHSEIRLALVKYHWRASFQYKMVRMIFIGLKFISKRFRFYSKVEKKKRKILSEILENL